MMCASGTCLLTIDSKSCGRSFFNWMTNVKDLWDTIVWPMMCAVNDAVSWRWTNMFGTYVRGELVVSCRWTGWVEGITGRSSRLQEFTHHFRGIFRRIHLELMKRKRKMSTCNQLDFENSRILTGYAQILPEHRSELVMIWFILPHDHQH